MPDVPAAVAAIAAARGGGGGRTGADVPREKGAKGAKEAKKRRPRRDAKVHPIVMNITLMVHTIGYGPRFEIEPHIQGGGMETRVKHSE